LPLRVTQVAPGVHRLSDAWTNWYLIEAGGRLTVLDAGLRRDWRYFRSALSRLNYSPSDIDAVLITHHHRDHAGNAERLRASGARVFSHPADAPYLRGEASFSDRGVVRYIWRPWYAYFVLSCVAKGILRTPAVAQLDALEDQAVVDVPGSPRVIHAPGHSPGSCALFLEEQSLLFTGDALVTLDVARGPRGRQGPQVARGPHTDDADQAVKSLDVLSSTKARTVLPGHGEPWTDGIESAVEVARRSR
jgi:glyoxylase-like metal-dependent hydrolase (beta-lactamase superfamily II)